MADQLLGIAIGVVRRFGIARFLRDYRHVHRENLFQLFHEARACEDPEFGFMRGPTEDSVGAAQFAIMIPEVAGRCFDRRAVMAELTRRSGERILRAHTKASLYILYYILDRSVAECTNNTGIWREMYRIVKTALEQLDSPGEDGDLNPFAPEQLHADVSHICGEVLNLAPFIEGKLDHLKAAIRAAFASRLDPPAADGGQSPEDSALSRVIHLATGIVQIGASHEGLKAALTELRNRYGEHADPTSIATYHAVLFLLNSLNADEPDVQESHDYFRGRVVETLISLS